MLMSVVRVPTDFHSQRVEIANAKPTRSAIVANVVKWRQTASILRGIRVSGGG
jgi:hypothetical protein